MKFLSRRNQIYAHSFATTIPLHRIAALSIRYRRPGHLIKKSSKPTAHHCPHYSLCWWLRVSQEWLKADLPGIPLDEPNSAGFITVEISPEEQYSRIDRRSLSSLRRQGKGNSPD